MTPPLFTSTTHLRRALTLPEVLATIALIAVIATAIAVPVAGHLVRSDHAARTADAARLNAALQALAADGRSPPPGADAAAVAEFLRPALSASRRLVPHNADDGRARLIWSDGAFHVARIGPGLRPADRDAPPVEDVDSPGVPTTPADTGPWLWAASATDGPAPPEVTPRPAPILTLRQGFTILNGPVTLTTPGTVTFLLTSNPPGDLVLRVGGMVSRGHGMGISLTFNCVPGDERDLTLVGERLDPDPAARGRLAIPLHLRLAPACDLRLEAPASPVVVPEDGTTIAELTWRATWSHGTVESGLLRLPISWVPPGGQDVPITVRHQHAGHTAEATVIARHAAPSAPLHWTANLTRGSLPWTGLHWAIADASTQAVLWEQTVPLTDSPAGRPGDTASLGFDFRLPVGSWRLTASLYDTAGVAATASHAVTLAP